MPDESEGFTSVGLESGTSVSGGGHGVTESTGAAATTGDPATSDGSGASGCWYGGGGGREDGDSTTGTEGA